MICSQDIDSLTEQELSLFFARLLPTTWERLNKSLRAEIEQEIIKVTKPFIGRKYEESFVPDLQKDLNRVQRQLNRKFDLEYVRSFTVQWINGALDINIQVNDLGVRLADLMKLPSIRRRADDNLLIPVIPVPLGTSTKVRHII